MSRGNEDDSKRERVRMRYKSAVENICRCSQRINYACIERATHPRSKMRINILLASSREHKQIGE